MRIAIGNLRLDSRPMIAAALSDKDLALLRSADMKVIDLIELRVDLFKSCSVDYACGVFSRVKKRFQRPVICTIRTRPEGGAWSEDEDTRYALFEALVPLADVVDIEIRSKLFEYVIELSHGFKKPVIASYHNLKLTPANAYLLRLLSKAGRASADITKLALKANGMDDVARLACFTNEHRHGNLITMSLGDKGKLSRLINPFFGSLVTYGYVGKPKADGQMHVRQLAEQLKMYGGKIREKQP